MSHERLIDLINMKITEVFLAYQIENDIPSGDISPLDALRLHNIMEQLANLIESIHTTK